MASFRAMPRWLITLLALAAFAMAAVALGNIVLKAYADGASSGPRWGHDLTQWWQGGSLLIQRRDPYTTIVPSAAPVLLLLAPLAYAPWGAATLIWAAVNLLLAVICVWCMGALAHIPPRSGQGLLLLGLFLSLIATRQVIELGQISLLIAACTLGALLLERDRPWLAGVLLGIAISKYTMSLPVLLVALLAGRWKVVAGCVATQVLALLAVALIAWTSPLVIIGEYLGYSTMIMGQTQDYAIHLLSLGWGPLGPLALAGATLALAALLGRWLLRPQAMAAIRAGGLASLTFAGALTLWSMYAVYHGRQDMVLSFLFVPIALGRTNHGADSYRLPPRAANTLAAFTWATALYWCLPGYAVLGMPAYRSIYALLNVAISLAWAALLLTIPPQPQGER